MSAEYPKESCSSYPESLLKTAKLADAIANDWYEWRENPGENEWVPMKIQVSIGHYAVNDDGTENQELYTLTMKVQEIMLELWFMNETPELDVDSLFEEYMNLTEPGDETSDLNISNITDWVASVEKVILEDSSLDRLQSIYENFDLLDASIETWAD